MEHKIKFENSFLALHIHTNSLRIKKLIGNVLDPKACRFMPDQHRMTVDFLINEYKPQNNNFLYQHRINENATSASFFENKLTQVTVDVKNRTVLSQVFGYREGAKEQILDLILFKPIQQILSQEGFSYLHASVVRKGEKCIFIVGAQNAGKSTLALSLLGYGLSILTDDDCFIKLGDDKVIIYPFETKIGIKRKSLKICPQVKRHIIKNYEYGKKLRFSANALQRGPNLEGPYYSCKMIIFPVYKNGKTGLRKLTRDEALVRLIQQDYRPLEADPGRRSFWNFCILARQAQAYELVYNDNNRSKALGSLVSIFDKLVQ